jgi:hypothetical protein
MDIYGENNVTSLLVFAVLAAWFRLKYPHITIGALASSSPILNFMNLTSPYSFNDIITRDFRVSLFLLLGLEKFELLKDARLICS